MSSVLNLQTRTRNLQRLADEDFDVLVIGGGITGAGCALDAATRGLKVALVEKRDLAAGTSSRSSKLIHGGLRYLEQLEFGLVREALRERSLLSQTICPHLVQPVRFVYPLRSPIWERAYVGTGVMLYDALATMGGNTLPAHRHLSRTATKDLVPALREDLMTGSVVYSDGQVDDARHCLTVARTAGELGAVIVTSARVTELDRSSHGVSGAVVRDLEAGDTIDIRARTVVNATGVWTDEIQRMAGRADLHVRASKGIHLLIPRDRIAAGAGLILRTETSVLFVIPWFRHWIVGTTDTDWALDLSHPAASRTDIDYLLDQLNDMLESPITHDDIVGVYAGLRPLLHGESDATSQLSREHAVSEPVPGLITIAGGKYTTYRVMAEDAIDAAAARLGHRSPSRTETTPLLGAATWPAWRARRSELARVHRLPIATIDRMLGRYGDEVGEVLDLARARPALGDPVPGAPDHIGAELVRSVTHEGALHLDDVLTRRTRISIEADDRGLEAAELAASLMAEELGWSEATRDRELRHYQARVAAELDSQRQGDDETADAARLGAPDVRTSAILD